MGISVSLLMAAAGAILLWAVEGNGSGFDVNAVGLILLIVGIVGGLLSLAFWSSWGGFGGERRVERETVIRE